MIQFNKEQAEAFGVEVGEFLKGKTPPGMSTIFMAFKANENGLIFLTNLPREVVAEVLFALAKSTAQGSAEHLGDIR